ncbi:MAG: autotransporter domain-containing protein, partial [Desulfonatronovibrio sp.]
DLYPIELMKNKGEIKAATDSGIATGVSSNVFETFHNSGSIIAEAEAEDSAATGVFLVGNQNLENSGTISAHNNLGQAYGVELVQGNLINHSTGIIKGESTSGDAWALMLSDSKAVNNGTVVGDTVLEHGSLLMGNGSFTGSVDNKSGIVSPGNSIGTINITGDYTQGNNSVLEIELDSNNSDKLVVTGTANLDGTLRMIPLGYVPGKSYSFFDAGSINGSFASYQSPAVFNIGIDNIDNNLSMDITRNSYKSLTSSSSQNNMASTLDQIRPSASGNMAQVLNLMDTMQLPQLQNSMKDLYPGMNAAAGYAALQGAQRVQGDLHSSLGPPVFQGINSDNSSKDKKESYTLSSWGTFMGSNARMKSASSIPGFREKMNGLMLGIDYNLENNFTLGVAGAIAYQDLDQRGGAGSSTVKSYQGYLYSKWDNIEDGTGAYWNTSLGAGVMDIETRRLISFLDRKTKSRHSARIYSASTGSGYVFKSGNWAFKPGLNIDYALLREDSYSESRAGDVSLDIDSRDSQSLQSRLGISLSREVRLKKVLLVPELRMHWTREYISNPKDLSASFKDQDLKFKAKARKIPENSGTLGLALNARFSENVFGAVDYEYTFMDSNHGSEQRMSAQLKIRF